MQPAEQSADTLRAHITGTYLGLRIGIGLVGIALPLTLWLGGRVLFDRALVSSMSGYYHTEMRDIFVGALVAIGLFIHLYKGFSTAENIALNVGGVLAIAVALIPTTPPDVQPRGVLSLHTVCAVLFFVSIAYVCIFRAPDTLSLIRDTKVAKKFERTYKSLGAAMIVLPIGAVVVARALQLDFVTFLVEAAAVWTFAAYWLVKSVEIKQSDADLLALNGKLKAASSRPAAVPTSPGRLVQTAPTDDEEVIAGATVTRSYPIS